MACHKHLEATVISTVYDTYRIVKKRRRGGDISEYGNDALAVGPSDRQLCAPCGGRLPACGALAQCRTSHLNPNEFGSSSWTIRCLIALHLERGKPPASPSTVGCWPSFREWSGACAMRRVSVKSKLGVQRHAGFWLSMWCLVVALCHSGPANADDTSEIAKQAQNPIASAISVPFQNNATFDVGEN